MTKHKVAVVCSPLARLGDDINRRLTDISKEVSNHKIEDITFTSYQVDNRSEFSGEVDSYGVALIYYSYEEK